MNKKCMILHICMVQVLSVLISHFLFTCSGELLAHVDQLLGHRRVMEDEDWRYMPACQGISLILVFFLPAILNDLFVTI